MAALSRTQIGKLGERLKGGHPTEADLRELDEYRRSFGDAYQSVVTRIEKALGRRPTGRQPKSVASIVEKLRRGSIRLNQIQDIAGCRLVVDDLNEQDEVVGAIVSLFPGSIRIDRRQQPSHGYRAVHVIVPIAGKWVEIQVRTALQQFWAQVSESYADRVDQAVKYGGGPEDVSLLLKRASQQIAMLEPRDGNLPLDPSEHEATIALVTGLLARVAELPRKSEVEG